MGTVNTRAVAVRASSKGLATAGLLCALTLGASADVLTVTNTADAGPGTLREVLSIANALPNADTIEFNVAGPGPHTIQLATALPAITNAVVINGYSQAGSSPNTTDDGNNAAIQILLTGGGVVDNGLRIQSAGCAVYGLAILDFASDGISLSGPANTVIQGNFIGLEVDGVTARGNAGVGILTTSAGAVIGGPLPGQRNMISGNLAGGIWVQGASSNVIQGNYIGTDTTGIQALGNLGVGIFMTNGPMNNLVGGTNAGCGNVIAHNAGPGVWLTSGTNAVLGNSLFSNGGLGIDLGATGVTINDLGDSDAGANNQQNYPLLDGVTNSYGITTIYGSLHSRPATTYRIEFFASTIRDPSGRGEGETFLGFIHVATDGSGVAVIATTLATGNLSGQFVSATATDPANNTSEFSVAPSVFFAEAPYITLQPANQSVPEGGTAMFSVGAGGGPPLQYQWTRDGTPVTGATNATFELNSVILSDAGSYAVVVTNLDGSVVSAAALLTVLLPTLPVLSTQPQSQTVSAGAAVEFSVSFSGVGPFAIQWRLNGVNIEGATNTSLALSGVQSTNSGAYSVVVSTAAGAVDSATAVLTVQLPALGFKDNFASLTKLNTENGAGRSSNTLATVEAGEPLHAGKAGGKTIWIMWQAPKSGIATFTTAGSTFDTLLGVYTGSTLSNLVEVASDDDSAGFHTSAVRFNALSGTQYKIAVDGFAGADGDAVLNWSLETTAQTLPVLVAHPESQTVSPGGSATFSVGATGAGLSYQWFFNHDPIPGAVGPELALSGVSEEHAGKYFVRVSNASRSINSRRAHLELWDPLESTCRHASLSIL